MPSRQAVRVRGLWEVDTYNVHELCKTCYGVCKKLIRKWTLCTVERSVLCLECTFDVTEADCIVLNCDVIRSQSFNGIQIMKHERKDCKHVEGTPSSLKYLRISFESRDVQNFININEHVSQPQKQRC